MNNTPAMTSGRWLSEGPLDAGELAKAWEQVKANYGSVRCEHPVNREVWQYMGSEHGLRNGSTGWWHCFRHRCLPTTGQRTYFWVGATPEWVATFEEPVKPKAPTRNTFNENDCSGVFDGFNVTSDADPGL